MSRNIDQWPAPRESKKLKVIIASASRSGTLGLYKAMKILGYKPYHMYECCAIGGVPHMKVLKEAVTSEHNRLSGIKKYTKADYDKWLADYDCVVEIPSYVGPDLIQAYAQDPDVKFIFTERPPEKWAVSVNNTVAGVVAAGDRFPFSILKYFDTTLYEFFTLNKVMYGALTGCTMPGHPDNERLLQKWYTDYVKTVKAIVPADRLCHIQLSDGLNWEKICPFLDLPIPTEEYPDRNEPEKFKARVEGFLKSKVISLAFVLALQVHCHDGNNILDPDRGINVLIFLAQMIHRAILHPQALPGILRVVNGRHGSTQTRSGSGIHA
ncbi:uncharacterized protein N7498_000303 [Penicillium cinerascens]|uniref:Uncharacterized protein n=1 Tax=Penicillium cinerascens TaxID=70096 RepID=A0A9W9NE74_9EURO|nr:uncharacterized protein N7498_000303 [Penicillium cinerascens]KAJ5218204.1 hypothetical protein N7498_000303 [Penicillium cinerascens]